MKRANAAPALTTDAWSAPMATKPLTTPVNLVQLESTLKRIRPIEGCEWLDGDDHESGLPTSIDPFVILGHRESDTFRLCANVKGDYGPIAEGLDFYEACHLMVDAVKVWQGMRPREVVYFIGTELRRGALIKVGTTRNLASRLNTLQTASGERLHVFATTPGGKALEAKYHRRWHLRRRNGEWFTLGDVILAEIERLTTTNGEVR